MNYHKIRNYSQWKRSSGHAIIQQPGAEISSQISFVEWIIIIDIGLLEMGEHREWSIQLQLNLGEQIQQNDCGWPPTRHHKPFRLPESSDDN